MNLMKAPSSYRKLAFATFLSLVGMKLFRIGRSFCARFIYTAIKLDPEREQFKKNIAFMGLNYYEIPKDIYSQKFSFYSVTEGCKLLSQKIDLIDTDQTISLSLPSVINSDCVISSDYQCEAKLPDTYLAEFNDATVFSNTDLILVKDVALYDEIERGKKYHYAVKSPIISNVSTDTLTLKIPSSIEKPIDIGIHFSKDHSANYFHWVIECLPRLSLIHHLDKNIPLLVDDDIPSQAFEALSVLNTDQRPIIRLRRNHRYLIKKLYYPSPLSTIHDNYNSPSFTEDIIYSPKALAFVRNTVLQNLKIDTPEPWRKIFLSRKNSRYRHLLNSKDIEDYLSTQGFEIVFPENLSFFSQVQLFSQAKIIIGQSGAGMANFLFSPKTCNVLMLYNNFPHCNLHLFGIFANAIGIKLKYLIGKIALELPFMPDIHADFNIDMNLLKQYLMENK